MAHIFLRLIRIGGPLEGMGLQKVHWKGLEFSASMTSQADAACEDCGTGAVGWSAGAGVFN